MYISKPDKGFSIPVIYVRNDKLYINDSEDIFPKVKEEKFQLFNFDGMTRDRLFTEEDEFELVINDREAEIKENYINKEDTSDFGILEFDDMEDSEIKKDQNLRTTMEVQYEDVGKLVIDKEDVESKKEEVEAQEEPVIEVKENKIN